MGVECQIINYQTPDLALPRHTLIFAIATLDFLVHPLLNLAFQNSSSCRLIKACSFKNMCCIDPIVTPPSHNTVAIDLELEHGDLVVIILVVIHAKRAPMLNVRVKMFL